MTHNTTGMVAEMMHKHVTNYVARLVGLLTWLRITDVHDRLVSLTSLAVWVVLIKLALVHNATVPDLAALLGCLGLYHAKRLSSAKERASLATPPVLPTQDVSAAMTEIRKVKDELAAQASKFSLMLDTVAMGRR